ncbi:hypothetical protein [Aquimarina celericrescens]|uniref:Lipocalin-like domain-containing protein n=1 Tax=Aquimarina celericrescens TaxID=1964542 RepID=A0ABW5AWW6_9FLAO|nr:hypothetical protein [Aquimarina celericrescens]
MKNILKFTALLMTITLVLFSCRSEDEDVLRPSEQDALKANTNVANLIQNTSMKDGSFDNIIDRANCFTIKTPFTVSVNGVELTVNNEEGLETAEDILDEFDDDQDIIEIQFPIVIIQEDFTEITIDDLSSFDDLASTCPDENEEDDDIECIDFQYPITATLFNNNNDVINDISINNDEELYEFIDDLDDDLTVSIDFPITLILSDQSEVTVNSIQQLEAVIEDAEDDCDEDDDYDYNDDDCDTCTTEQLTDFLTNCSDWKVDTLERNNQYLEDLYTEYTFNFSANGTIAVENGTDSFSGTWESTGTGNDITVTINIEGLDDFNGSWTLHEIYEKNSEFEVELDMGEDELEFESNC